MGNDAILDHVNKHVGLVATIFEEVISDDIRIDVLHVKSSLFRRFEVLVTRGMSTRPMEVPTESGQPRFAEVLAVLPKGWPLSRQDFTDENHYWPIRLIKTLARYPFEANTWLGFGHTLANGKSETVTKPYADNTSLSAVILLPSASLSENAWRLRRSDGDEVFFWAAVPLYMSELKFKMEHGVDPLLDLFDKRRVSDRIDPSRMPVI